MLSLKILLGPELSNIIGPRLPLSGRNVDFKATVELFQIFKETIHISTGNKQQPEIQSFLGQLKQIIDQMNSYQILALIIDIINFKQLRNHPANNCVINALIPKIRNLQFKDIALLDYRIHRMNLNSSYKELQLKIQDTFSNNVARILESCKEFEYLLMTTNY